MNPPPVHAHLPFPSPLFISPPFSAARTVLFDFSWVISTCVSAASYVLLVRLTAGPGPGTPFGAAGSVALLPDGGGEEDDSMLITVNSAVN